jgi:hypothetical protein
MKDRIDLSEITRRFTYQDWLEDQIPMTIDEGEGGGATRNLWVFGSPEQLKKLHEELDLLSEEDLNKIWKAHEEAFDIARRFNYELNKRRLSNELKHSPDPEEKLRREKKLRNNVLERIEDPYDNFISGRHVVGYISGGKYQEILSCWENLDKFEAGKWNLIKHLNKQGTPLDFDKVHGQKEMTGKNTQTMISAVLVVASNYDCLKLVEEREKGIELIGKGHGDRLEAAVIALILYFLQEKRNLKEGNSPKKVEYNLSKLGLLYIDEKGTSNSNTVRKKLNSIRGSHADRRRSALDKPDKIGHAAKWLEDNGYEGAATLARNEESQASETNQNDDEGDID